MNDYFPLSISGLVAIAVLSGCTATHALQRETIHQSNTISEIHQQQVLNNLAKFVHDPNALPDFAWPKEGAAQITDHCEGNGSVMWDAAGFMGATLGSLFSREKQDAWTLEPINDPRKLELMRCAYQKVVSNCGRGGPSGECPNCDAQTAAFQSATPVDMPSHDTVGYDCLTPGCCTWFAYGPKCKVPRGCRLVGHYCDMYVWIMPGGDGELTKLTLTILDYAMNDFPERRSMAVTLYRKEALDAQKHPILLPATADTATQVILADVPTNTDAAQVQPIPTTYTDANVEKNTTEPIHLMMAAPNSTVQASKPTSAPSEYLPPRRTQPNSGLDTLQLRMRLNALAPGK